MKSATSLLGDRSLAAARRLLRMTAVFILPIGLVLAVFGGTVSQLLTPLLQTWTRSDLDDRAELVARAMQRPIENALMLGDGDSLHLQLDRLTQDPRLQAIAICDAQGRPLSMSGGYPREMGCSPGAALSQVKGHVSQIPLRLELPAGAEQASLVIVHSPRAAWQRGEETQRYLLWLLAAAGVTLALVTLFLAHWSWRRWVEAVRKVLRTGNLPTSMAQTSPEVQPLVPDLHRLLHSVHEDRRILKETTIKWQPETLKLLLREHLFGDEIIVVSNREPCIHQRQPDGSVRVDRPASGLVTAIEPVMRACSGTWVAHGSGSADAEFVDARDRFKVLPVAAAHQEDAAQGAYMLRRVWLSEEEERGHYFGFSNEGLWPLCHISHVRPVFREDDWLQYQAVNAKFADAVVSEARSEDPVILVQDYHFALLPLMLRERLPKATIITFWHIPWPNPESFGICPWARQILQGMLGSSTLGFHTPYHCENFLATVDRFLESRITREDATVAFQGHRTRVRDYPISIHWEEPSVDAGAVIEAARSAVRHRHGLPPSHRLALGVDRMDYTKGIVERMLAVERLLELQPDQVGRFSLIQIAAPTRSTLPQYQQFESQVRSEAERINARFAAQQPDSAPAIILLMQHHDSDAVRQYHRGCDIAMVTSLHDGMNLVAKEFVAARELEDGVLILSRFTGAAAQLLEALIVNPYHINQMAQALSQALAMHPAEQMERMRAMRRQVSNFNIYRWAGSMLLDAADVRQQVRVRDRIDEVSTSQLTSRLFRGWRQPQSNRAESAGSSSGQGRTPRPAIGPSAPDLVNRPIDHRSDHRPLQAE